MSDFGRLKAGRCPRYIPHQEISTQITPILKSHLGMMSRTQCHTPYLVSPICPLKIKTTTIKDTDQEVEIINTTKETVEKPPSSDLTIPSTIMNINYSFFLQKKC